MSLEKTPVQGSARKALKMAGTSMEEKIKREDLNLGDHIYSKKFFMACLLDIRHGIYVGDGRVIHYTGGTNILLSPLDSFLHDSFLHREDIYRYQYGVTRIDLFSCKDTVGRCTYQNSDPPEIVIGRAYYLHGLKNGLGGYSDLFQNKSEYFAIYCKTRLHPDGQVSREDLNSGDHIYSWRTKPIRYTHHGIYVGNGEVIHYVNGPVDGKRLHVGSFSSGSDELKHAIATARVLLSTLDSFLHGGKLYRYEYGVSKDVFEIKPGGTCSEAMSDSSNVVVERAIARYKLNDFGEYDLLRNNCENFALYCTTGDAGISGQVERVLRAQQDPFPPL